MKDLYTQVLEPSTNTHTLNGKSPIKATDMGNSTVYLETEGNTYVTHGEHRTLGCSSKFIVKYVQQEVNPVTGIMQNAFD